MNRFTNVVKICTYLESHDEFSSQHNKYALHLKPVQHTCCITCVKLLFHTHYELISRLEYRRSYPISSPAETIQERYKYAVY